MSEENKEKEPTKKASPKAVKYSAICGARFEILGVKIVNGFSLTKELKDNKEFMQRFNHAVKIGVIVKD